MKRTKLTLLTVGLAALLPLATLGYAEMSHVAGQRLTPKKVSADINRIGSTKPDLKVTNIQAIQDGRGKCYLRVSLKNSGQVPIPDYIYSSRTKAIKISF